MRDRILQLAVRYVTEKSSATIEVKRWSESSFHSSSSSQKDACFFKRKRFPQISNVCIFALVWAVDVACFLPPPSTQLRPFLARLFFPGKLNGFGVGLNLPRTALEIESGSFIPITLGKQIPDCQCLDTLIAFVFLLSLAKPILWVSAAAAAASVCYFCCLCWSWEKKKLALLRQQRPRSVGRSISGSLPPVFPTKLCQ